MNYQYFRDTLVNFISGLGTVRDKTTGSSFVFAALAYDQLAAAYRSDWVARKIVDIPANDSTRAWRQWQGEKEQLTVLEQAENAYNLRNKVRQAMIRARLFGGAALVLGVDDGDQALPLEFDKVKKDSLKFVHVVSRFDMSTGPLIHDVMSPWYSEPSYYTRTTQNGTFVLHPSRVVRFVGNEIPERQLQTADSWGDSVLQSVDDAVRAAGIVSGGIAAMVQEAKIDVIKIPNLSNMLATEDYSDRLIKRFAAANQAKSIVNTLVLDKEEEWERINAQFTGLPELVKMYLLIASGASDIPATRMLGQSPVGMSATGESDTRNYYDRIASDQVVMLSPALVRLDEVLVRSVLGNKPPELYYDWNPLWQMSEMELADIAVKKAQAFQTDVSAGLIPEFALAQGRINQLIEDAVYPGLEQALDKAEEMGEDLESAVEQRQLAQEQMNAVQEAAARSAQEGDDEEGTGTGGTGGTRPPFAKKTKDSLSGQQGSSVVSGVRRGPDPTFDADPTQRPAQRQHALFGEESKIEGNELPEGEGEIELLTTIRKKPTRPGERDDEDEELDEEFDEDEDLEDSFDDDLEDSFDDELEDSFDDDLDDEEFEDELDALEDELDELDELEDSLDDEDDEEFSDGMPYRTLYVSRPVVNIDEIARWAATQGMHVLNDDPHVTIAYSREKCDWSKMGEPWDNEVGGRLTIGPGGMRSVESFGRDDEQKVLVLVFSSSSLSSRHSQMCSSGASWDWPDYMPHITLCAHDPSIDLASIEAYQGQIILGPERFAEVKEADQ